MTKPPRETLLDRSKIATEQRNKRSANLHELSASECVQVILEEDRAVFEAMHKASGALAGLIEEAEPGFLAGGRLIYLGAGTSGRLGVLDASEAPPTFQVEPGRVVGLIAGGDAALRRSSEHLEDDPAGARTELESLCLTERDTIIGIAAGGTTPYVRGGITCAKERAPQATTALLTCAHVERPQGCDHLIVLETGPEVITGSTRMKAGTATKLALNTLSTTLMVRAGKVYQNLMVDVRATNDKLLDRAARIVCSLTGLSRSQALELLEHCSGSVKQAVVMQRLALDAQAAQQALEAAHGRLHVALGESP